MTPLISVATILSGAVLALMVVALAIGEYVLVARLRRDHPATWRAIGSPSPWFTHWQDFATVSKFLGRRGYDNLGDPQLKSLGNKLRILTTVVFALGATTLLLVVLARISEKHR